MLQFLECQYYFSTEMRVWRPSVLVFVDEENGRESGSAKGLMALVATKEYEGK